MHHRRAQQGLNKKNSLFSFDLARFRPMRQLGDVTGHLMHIVHLLLTKRIRELKDLERV